MTKKQFFVFLLVFIIFEVCLFFFKRNSSLDKTIVVSDNSSDKEIKEEVIINDNSINNSVVAPSLNVVNIECDSLSFLDYNSIFINGRCYSLNSVFGKYGTINRIFDGIVFIQGWDLGTVYILTEKIYLNDFEKKNEGKNNNSLSLSEEVDKMNNLIHNESSKNLKTVF